MFFCPTFIGLPYGRACSVEKLLFAVSARVTFLLLYIRHRPFVGSLWVERKLFSTLDSPFLYRMVRSRRDYFIGNTYFFLNLWFLPEICFFTITMWPYLFHDTLLAAMVPLRVKTFGGLSPFRFFNEHSGCEHRHHPFVTVDDWLTRKFSHLSTLWSFSFHG